MTHEERAWYVAREAMAARKREEGAPNAALLIQSGQWDDSSEVKNAYVGALAALRHTGTKDKHGNDLYLGDRVRYRIEGPHTKREYWNPEYVIVWNPPAFDLEHVGGGKDGGDHTFILKHGGGNGDLELVFRPEWVA